MNIHDSDTSTRLLYYINMGVLACILNPVVERDYVERSKNIADMRDEKG